MASLTLRSIKGAPLTNAELDANFTNLNTELGVALPRTGGTMTGAITFAGAQAWPTFNQNTTGSAATLATGRTIALTGDVTYTSGSFNGSANVTGVATLAASGVTAGTYPKVTVDAKGRVTAGAALSAGDVPTLNQSTTGNAATATSLQTARTINGVSFNGTTNITIADATKLPLSGGTLTGPLTLNNVTKGNQIFTTSDVNNATLTIKGLNFTHAVFFNDSYNTGEYAKLSGGHLGQALLRLTGFSALNTVSATSDYASNYASIAGTLSATGAITQAGNQVLHAGNFNSYSPTLTGTGASGSWGISVTGNAATATTLQTARTINGVSFNGSANVTVTTAGTGIGVSGTAVSIAAAYSPNTSTELPAGDLNTYQTAGFYHQTANADTSTANNYPVANAGSLLIQRSAGITQQYQTYGTTDTELYFRSFYNTVWGGWRRVLTSSNYNSYSPTLTGTGASGTWGISVTGNAATVTNGLVSTGSYADPAWLTSVNYSKLTGTVPTWNQSTTGNAATATALQTARTINGVSFNGSANITVADATKLPLTGGTLTGNVSTSGTVTATSGLIGRVYGAASGAADGWIWSVSPANPTWGMYYNEGTPDAIEFRAADVVKASIFLDTGAATFGSTVTAPTFSGALSGNATTATSLQTARTIGGVSFNGTANINLPGVNAAGNQNTTGTAAGLTDNSSWMLNRGTVAAASIDTATANGFYNQTNVGDSQGVLVFNAGGSLGPLQMTFTYGGLMQFRGKTDSATWTAWKTVLTSANFGSYAPSLTGAGASGTWGISVTGSSASTTGNAATATTLQTARTINGTTFNGSANITTASWGTARDINGTSVNGSGNYAIGRIYDTAYKRITNPGGAEAAGASSSTGAIAITLPVGMTNSMVRMTIKVYEYQTNESFEVHCGGYNYATGATWANNPFAYIVGNPSIDRRFTVRFGYDSVALKAIVYIGELASTWAHAQVFVTDVQVGYGGQSVTWTSGWAIGFEAAAFKAVTATITNCQVGYAVSTNTANSAVLRDGSGNFSAGTISAALTGNASTATALQTARTIGGVSFNGTANINLPGVNAAGNQSTTGNAATATALQTARTINGVSFNGTANITVADSTKLPLSGGTLTGLLASGRNDTERVFESRNTSAGSPAQFFIEHSYGSVNIGNLRGNLNVSSGALQQAGNQVLHAGNYNSYAPTLTGGGASGTWGISVTGSAATLTTARTIALSGAVTGTATSFNGSASITIPTTVSATQGGLIYGSSTTAYASTAAGTAGQIPVSNGTSAPTWQSFDLSVHARDSSYKKVVRVATTADLGAATATGTSLIGYPNTVSLAVTTTASSTTATTTSTVGFRVGSTLSGNANIPAGATVASITNATTFVLSVAATTAATGITTTFTTTIAAINIDGVALALNDRVLVKDQRTVAGLIDPTAAKYNGIYYVSAVGSTTAQWVLTRALDADSASDLDSAVVNVSVGTSNFGKTYKTRFSGASTLNTTEMYWSRLVDVNSSSLAATPVTARGLHIDTDTETVMFKSGNVTDFASNVLGITTVQATAASTYTRASTLYIAGAPVAGTNATITTPYSLYVASGNSHLGATATATTFSGALSGNATTATTLQTARTINGTSFNGSANITTANWGTARTLTLGATGKSVSGSANVAWTFSEIAAGQTITTSGSTASLVLSDTGASGANIRLIGNGATTPNKTIRAQAGMFQVINSGYTAPCMSVYDNGDLVMPGQLYAGNTNLVLHAGNFSSYGITRTTGSPAYYGARAWVNFNGVGTVAIRASSNVSSITDLDTGIYRANFATAMPDTNYTAAMSITGANTNEASRVAVVRGETFTGASGKLTTSLEILTGFGWAGGTQDNAEINLIIFR